MANAKLHIICGNCGCNDMIRWEFKPTDFGFDAAVWLKCENCSTIHDINDNAKQVDPPANAKAHSSTERK